MAKQGHTDGAGKIRRVKRRAIETIVLSVLVGTAAITLATWLVLFITEPPEPAAERESMTRTLTLAEMEQGRVLAETFLSDVHAGRNDDAYTAYVTVFNKRMSRDDFEAHLRKQPKLVGPISYDRCEVNECHPFGTYGQFFTGTSESGKSIRIKVGIGTEGSKLGIQSFRVDRAE